MCGYSVLSQPFRSILKKDIREVSGAYPNPIEDPTKSTGTNSVMRKRISAFSTLINLLTALCLFAAPTANIIAAGGSTNRQVQQTKPNILAKINFNPKVDGFGFQNYTNSKHVWQDDMNAGDMIRLFGAKAVCLKGSTAQDCVMKASLRASG